MPKSFLVKKYTNDSHYNSSKWSKLYSSPSSLSSTKTTITSSQADLNSASLLLNLSKSTSNNLFNGKNYSNDYQQNHSTQIYLNKPFQTTFSSLLSISKQHQQQQKSKFLLPPSNKHLNGNSTINKSNNTILNNGNLKTTFNKQTNDKPTVDLNQPTSTNKTDSLTTSFKKQIPSSNSLNNKQQQHQKSNLIKFNDKRQTKPTKTIKDNLEQKDNQKKTEQVIGNDLLIDQFFNYYYVKKKMMI